MFKRLSYDSVLRKIASTNSSRLLYFSLFTSLLALVIPISVSTVASAATTYNITFNANGGSGGGVEAVADTTDAIPLAMAVYNNGHTLVGFSSTPDGSVVPSYIVSGADATLYAIWSLNSYLVSFDTQGGGTNTSVSLPYFTDALQHAPAASKPGLALLGWSTTPGGTPTQSYAVSGPTTLYAIYGSNSSGGGVNTPANYQVTFNPNGGVGSNLVYSLQSGSNALGTKPDVSFTGHSLTGWSLTPNGSKLDSYLVNSSVTLYAVWAPILYNVTFDPNGGVASTLSYLIPYGVDALATKTEVSFEGRSLVGWSLTVNGSKLSTYNVTGDVILHAIWSNASYKVTFDPNGGIDNPKVVDVPYLVDAISLAPKNFSLSGYSLVGWSDSKTGLASTVYKAKSDVTLYAIWKMTAYNISFNGNLGSWGSVPDSLQYLPSNGTPVVLPDPKKLAKPGYVFSGWSESKNGNILYSPYTPTKDVTLYAIWTPATKSNIVNIPAGKDTTVTLDSAYGTPDSIISFGLGLDSVTLNGSDVTYSAPLASSGLTSIKVLFKGNSGQKIVEIPVLILSVGPVNLSVSSTDFSTSTVSWYAYDKNFSYSLYVDGRNECNTTKFSCKINKIIGPKSNVYLVTHIKIQGDLKSTISYQQGAPILASSISFPKGSLTFKVNGKIGLTNLVSAVNGKGFTQVLLLGKMSKFQDKAVYDKLTALMPKAKIILIDYTPGMVSNKDKPSKADLFATTANILIS